jgi:hypothetical protein
MGPVFALVLCALWGDLMYGLSTRNVCVPNQRLKAFGKPASVLLQPG